MIKPFLLSTIIIFAFTLVSCTRAETTATQPLPGMLQAQQIHEVALPGGGQILSQVGESVLFLGSQLQRTPTRYVVFYDAVQKRQLWDATLPGSAIKAIHLPGGDFILVTIQEKGNAHLLRLDGETGAILWDVPYANPTLDALWREDMKDMLVSDGVSLWQVAPRDGRQMALLATGLGQSLHPDSVVLARSVDDPQTLYLSNNSMLLALNLKGGQAMETWRFSSAKFIAQLLPVHFFSGEQGVIALAHSNVYFVDAAGKLAWHIKNKDINYTAIALPNAQETEWVVFGNFVKGIYVVDAHGQRAHQPLPGGNVRILGIPVPIPKNILLGGIRATSSAAGAFPGYLLATRSLDNVFVYQLSPTGKLSLIAESPVNPGGEEMGTLIQQAQSNPNYPPFFLDDYLAVSQANGITQFTLTLEGGS